MKFIAFAYLLLTLQCCGTEETDINRVILNAEVIPYESLPTSLKLKLSKNEYSYKPGMAKKPGYTYNMSDTFYVKMKINNWNYASLSKRDGISVDQLLIEGNNYMLHKYGNDFMYNSRASKWLFSVDKVLVKQAKYRDRYNTHLLNRNLRDSIDDIVVGPMIMKPDHVEALFIGNTGRVKCPSKVVY